MAERKIQLADASEAAALAEAGLRVECYLIVRTPGKKKKFTKGLVTTPETRYVCGTPSEGITDGTDAREAMEILEDAMSNAVNGILKRKALVTVLRTALGWSEKKSVETICYLRTRGNLKVVG